MEIFLAIVCLSLLIIIHEAGHYVCALATGMKVDRFSVFGIGPVVARLFTWRGTEFVISGIPFGAYVHIVGMEADDVPSAVEGGRPGERYEYDPKDPTLYRNRPVWARMIAILGGPAANYLAAIVFLFFSLAVVGNEVALSMRVDEVSETAAKEAGLSAGDEILRVAGVDVTGRGTQGKIAELTSAHKGETVEIVVRRAGAEQALQIPLTDEGKIGIKMVPEQALREIHPVGKAAEAAVVYPIRYSAAVLRSLGKLFTGQSREKLGGPIAIVREIAKSARRGFEAFLETAITISILLGLFNLLPLPALDGGRFMFQLWEALTRHPVNRRTEESIHGIGMLALLGLILYVTFANDLFGR